MEKIRAGLGFNHRSELKHSPNVILIHSCHKADKLPVLTGWKVILVTDNKTGKMGSTGSKLIN